MLQCIIIEDQPPAQRILKKFIEDIGTLELKAVFSDAISAMEFLNSEKIELIFLDIHLPKMSGLDFLKTVQQPPKVILTTAFSEYALESYDYNVVDYLLKPFSFQRFVKAVQKAQNTSHEDGLLSQKAKKELKEIFIKSGHDLVKINLDELMYIKSDTDYTELFLSEKKYLSAESLRYWEENLDSNQFYRVHKSYIINRNKIEKLSASQIILKNKTSIPIGRVYKDNFMARISNNS